MDSMSVVVHSSSHIKIRHKNVPKNDGSSHKVRSDSSDTQDSGYAEECFDEITSVTRTPRELSLLKELRVGSSTMSTLLQPEIKSIPAKSVVHVPPVKAANFLDLQNVDEEQVRQLVDVQKIFSEAGVGPNFSARELNDYVEQFNEVHSQMLGRMRKSREGSSDAKTQERLDHIMVASSTLKNTLVEHETMRQRAPTWIPDLSTSSSLETASDSTETTTKTFDLLQLRHPLAGQVALRRQGQTQREQLDRLWNELNTMMAKEYERESDNVCESPKDGRHSTHPTDWLKTPWIEQDVFLSQIMQAGDRAFVCHGTKSSSQGGHDYGYRTRREPNNGDRKRHRENGDPDDPEGNDSNPQKDRSKMLNQQQGSNRQTGKWILCPEPDCQGRSASLSELLRKLADCHARYICGRCWQIIEKNSYDSHINEKLCRPCCVCRDCRPESSDDNDDLRHDLVDAYCCKSRDVVKLAKYRYVCHLLGVRPQTFVDGEKREHNGEIPRRTLRQVQDEIRNREAAMQDRLAELENQVQHRDNIIRQCLENFDMVGYKVPDSLYSQITTNAPYLLEPVKRSPDLLQGLPKSLSPILNGNAQSTSDVMQIGSWGLAQELANHKDNSKEGHSPRIYAPRDDIISGSNWDCENFNIGEYGNLVYGDLEDI